MKTLSKLIISLIILNVSGLTAQVFNNGPSYNEGVPLSNTDSATRLKIQEALAKNSALRNDNIQYTIVNGSVTLTGTVSSDSKKSIAESIVNGVDGVTFVNNQLVVVPK